MKKVLLKDITIPAGTVFYMSPIKTMRDTSHYDCVVCLSDNTLGVLTYGVDDYPDELDAYFANLKE